MQNRIEEIVLGGGCFWCVEAVLRRVEGVVDTECGYAGGHKPNPTYEEVCGGTTGHAEVVRVRFDAGRLSLEELLEVFFSIHDPTSRDRQGPDVGSQYRSIVLCTSEEQVECVRRFIEERVQPAHSKQVVTEVRLLEVFYPAEEYHQNFYEKNPDHPYCATYIKPKVERLVPSATGKG